MRTCMVFLGLALCLGAVDAGPDDDYQPDWALCCDAACKMRTSMKDCTAAQSTKCRSSDREASGQDCGPCQWVYRNKKACDEDDDDKDACSGVCSLMSTGGVYVVKDQGRSSLAFLAFLLLPVMLVFIVALRRAPKANKHASNDVEAAVIMPETGQVAPDVHYSARSDSHPSQLSGTATSASRPSAPPPPPSVGVGSEGFKACGGGAEEEAQSVSFPPNHPIAWTAVIKDRGGGGASAPTLPLPPACPPPPVECPSALNVYDGDKAEGAGTQPPSMVGPGEMDGRGTQPPSRVGPGGTC